MPEYVVLYDVDWRDAFADLGAVDLNSPGATLTYEGITWTTPAIADGSATDQVTSTSWGLTSTGLRCVEPDNSTFTATNVSAPHIYATLADIAANSVSPFDGDPTRQYLFQVFVSAQSLTPAGVENEGAGVGIYKDDFGGGVGNANISMSMLGHRIGVDGTNFFRAGVGALPSSRGFVLDFDVPTLLYNGSGGSIDGYCIDFDVDDWPANSGLRKIAGYRNPAGDIDNDTIQDPLQIKFASVHTSASVASLYDGTIQRTRLLRQ